MKELEFEAKIENLDKVLMFIDEQLEEMDCSMKTQMQIDIAAEEIFVNIAKYAYAPEIGKVAIQVDFEKDPLSAVLTFIDQGVPYDPLEKPDPDVTLSIEERQIGGLGIFMVKKNMDHMSYEYKNGSNILTLKKGLQ